MMADYASSRWWVLSQFRNELIAKFESLDHKMGLNSKRFDSIDQNFNSVHLRFASIDQRFDSIDKRFDSVDKRFDAMENKIESLHLETKGEIAKLHGEVHRIGLLVEEQTARNIIVLDGLANLFARQDRVESRLDAIEKG